MKRTIIIFIILLFPSFVNAYDNHSVISQPVTNRAISYQGSWGDCLPDNHCDTGMWVFQRDDGLANEFIIDRYYRLTNVSGWFRYYDDAVLIPDVRIQQRFIISLFKETRANSNSDNIPNSLLKSWPVLVPHAIDNASLERNDIFSVNNLDIMLSPGKYWIAALAGADGLLMPGDVIGEYISIANAGPDQIVGEGTFVQLDGSGSIKPAGPTTYDWTQTSGPTVSLDDPTIINPSFTAPVQGTDYELRFTLEVTDLDNSIYDTDEVAINVETGPAICGNTITEGVEACDSDTTVCTAPGGYPGTMTCNSQCTGYDACTSTEYCGDGNTTVPEVCDGDVLPCTAAGGYVGTSDCNAQCDGYDACTTAFYCGDGICSEPPEDDNSCPADCGTPFTTTLQAESMPTKTTGGSTSGGWNIWTDGYIEGPVDFPSTGTYRFDITARGSIAQGVWPNMELRIDQSTEDNFTVDSTSWKVYTTYITVTQGNRDVAIAFTNDYYNPPSEDRNLKVDKIVITKEIQTSQTEVIETFSTAIAALDGQSFGSQGQLTFELDRNGTFIIDGTSGLAWQRSDSYLDSGIIRSTNALPQTYKISLVAGDIDYGLENLDGLQNDPNYSEGPLNENGCYLLAITDQLPTVPHTNDWWHQHRKVVIDVDNNVMGHGMPNPIFMVYFDNNNSLFSYDGGQNQWVNHWTDALKYQENTFYRIEIEKTLSNFIFRALTESGQILKETSIALSNVWHADGTAYPEYLVIGDPHENYYQGSMKIKEIAMAY